MSGATTEPTLLWQRPQLATGLCPLLQGPAAGWDPASHLLGSCAELSQSCGQVLGTLAELHRRGLVRDSRDSGLGCSYHLPTRLPGQKEKQ